MPTYDITDSIVSPLGVEAASAAEYTISGVQYDHSVAGVPFLSAASDERPYERALAEVQKQQVDQGADPGEQSLSLWWSRSQSDWSGGSGSEYMEPVSDERAMRSFWRSSGVDPWTAGKLSLLYGTTGRETYSGGSGREGIVGTAAAFYVFNGTDVDLCVPNGTHTTVTVTACTGLAGDIQTVAIGGGKVLVRSGNGKIYSADVGASAFTETWNNAGSTGKLWFIKHRWIVDIGADVYMGALPTSGLPKDVTTDLTKVHTGPAGISSFIWRAFADAPDSIIGTGYTLTNESVVMRFTVDSAGGIVTLTAAATVAEMPIGETIYAMDTYLGSYVVLVTNLGVRVGLIGQNGSIQYGPLSFESTDTVTLIAPPNGAVYKYDRFAYVPYRSTETGAAPGLIRFDLSDIDDAGRCPWAFDVAADDVNTDGWGAAVYAAVVVNPSQVWLFGNHNQFSTTDTLWGPTNERVASGWVESGWVRYNTLEDKNFSYVSVQGQSPYYGSVTVSTVDKEEAEQTVATLSTGSSYASKLSLNLDPQERIRVKLTLAPDGADSPVVDGWQLRALPALQRQELVRLPLLCFDFERDQKGQQVGYEGYALSRWQTLRDAVRTGGTLRWKDHNTGEALTCVVEDMVFQQVAPPVNASGFGGVLTVTVRTV